MPETADAASGIRAHVLQTHFDYARIAVAVREDVIESREAVLLTGLLHIIQLITGEREIINIASIKRSGTHWETRHHGLSVG
jgi:hypothetical protein